ncbi:MAG: nitroreductase family protein [Dehalococcoidales bacterium]|nr:nitroreductase family protein [Dehalococcoidales bacterium]
MQVFSIIKKRRSVRFYTDEAIAEDKLKKLVEAAIWAPSAGNIHAWNIVILERKEDIERVKAISPGILGNPTALMILCADKRRAYDKRGEVGRDVLSIMDIAIAAQNICLEATELGLGSCIIRSFNQDAVRELLDLPKNIAPELLVSLGYPRSIPNSPPRRTAEDTVICWIKGGNDQ